MEEMRLEAAVRTMHGKGGARKLRAAGMVPGVVYGVTDPLAIQCNTREADRLIETAHGANRLIALNVRPEAGQATEKHVLLKQVQTTPVGQHLLHLDFQEVDLSKTVQVQVTLHAVGEPEGTKVGGLLQTVTHSVLVECLPGAIPAFIEVNVEALGIGDSMHVRDMKMPEGVRAITSKDETIFVITAPTAVVEEQKAAAAAAAAAALAPPPVEGEVPLAEGAEGALPGAIPGAAPGAAPPAGAAPAAAAAPGPAAAATPAAAAKPSRRQERGGSGGRGR